MNPAKNLQALTEAEIFTGSTRVQGQALLFQGQDIIGVVPHDSIPSGAERHPLPGCVLVPGLIDLQVNGGGNVLFNDAPTKDSVLAIAKAHRRMGTTRLLPTCITDAPEVTHQAIESARAARREDPSILGIHLEGPHITRLGAHPARYARALQDQDIQIYAPKEGEIVLITLAPESATPEQIAKLTASGVIVSIGHTDASPEQVRAALQAGARGFTHLYNVMGGLSGRVPGVLGTALDDQASWCGLIADTLHVAPALVRVALRAKPQGKIFFVSDAMPPAGAAVPLPFQLVGKTGVASAGGCVDQAGTLMGSALTLLQILRIAVDKIGLTPDQVLAAATSIPAAFIGAGNRLGAFTPGAAADILALDATFAPKAVWLAGQEQEI